MCRLPLPRVLRPVALGGLLLVHVALPPRGAINPAPPAARDRRAAPVTKEAVPLSALPLRFERNVGQADPDVDALVQGSDHVASIHRAALTLFGLAEDDAAVRISMRGARASASPVFGVELPGASNYLVGPDPSRWHLHVKSYETVHYGGIYPGVDLLFHARGGSLEFDFLVAPGADAGRIALVLEGGERVRVREGGELELRAGRGVVRLEPPHAYQESGGRRRTVAARYRLDGDVVRFEIGQYDGTRPLVIDPVVLYTVYPGGSAANYHQGVAISGDPAGNVYVTGRYERPVNRWSTNPEVFVMKIDPTTRAAVYTTYLGGTQEDTPYDIAVNAAGEAYVYGLLGLGFPDAAGYRYNCPCDQAQFVVKLNAAGNAMIYQARMRASLDRGGSIALDAAGHLWLTGTSTWAGPGFEPCCLPIVAPSQPTFGGGSDAYVLRLNPAGSDVLFGSYLGGAAAERAAGIDVDGDGSVYLTGTTDSANFPVVNPVQPAPGGLQDLFVTRLSGAGAVTFSTLLGGSGDEDATASAIDAAGFVYLAGRSSSLDFPVVNPAWPRPPSATAPIAVKLSPASRSVVYATFFGGSGVDVVRTVATDGAGALLIGGTTSSPDFPRLRAFQEYTGTSTYPRDGFVVQLAAGGTLLDSSVIGTSHGDDEVVGLAALSGGSLVAVTNVLFWGSPGNMAVKGLSTALAVSGVLPRVLPPGEGGWVKLAGQNFASGAQVFIGGMFAGGVEPESTVSLVARLPALPPGTYDVVVANPAPYGQIVHLADAVQYSACTFTLPWTLGFTANGGVRALPVPSAPWGCGWTADATADWIEVLTPAGMGYGSPLGIRVAPNHSAAIRRAFLRVNDHSIEVTQAPPPLMDFDSDGRMDLLWQHDSHRRLAAWMMDGVTRIGESPLTPDAMPETGWRIAGAADLDENGSADLVWQHDDGRLAAWLMDGLIRREELPLAPGRVDETNWRIRTVGDINGDGHADLIWQHAADGRLAAWIMDGVRQRWGVSLEPGQVLDVGWQIAGNGDFNDDGRLDLVWQHTDGTLAVWLMDGLTLLDGRLITWPVVSDPAWRVRAVGDLDGDGPPDLIWQHAIDGRVSMWRMLWKWNEPTCVDATLLTPSQAETGWTIVGPR